MNSPLRKALARHEFAVRMILLLLGAVMISLAFLLPDINAGHTILISLGITLSSTTIVLGLDSFFGTDAVSQVRQVEDRLRAGLNELGNVMHNHEVYERGLRAVYRSLVDANQGGDFRKLLEDAHSIDMLHNAGRYTITSYKTDIVRAVTRHRCRVRILVSDPNSTIWDDAAVNGALAPNSKGAEPIRHLIYSTRSEVQEIVAAVKDLAEGSQRMATCGSIELREYVGLSPSNVIIIDRDFVRHTPRLLYAHTEDVPVFDIARGVQDTDLLECYTAMFDRVWRDSREVLRYDPRQ